MKYEEDWEVIVKFCYVGVIVYFYMSYLSECSVDKNLINIDLRENWNEDIKILVVINFFAVFCYKGE